MADGDASDPFSSTSFGDDVFQSFSLKVLGLSMEVRIAAQDEVTTMRLTLDLNDRGDEIHGLE